MEVSFWSSLSQALGIGKGAAGARNQIIQTHLVNLKHENPDMRRSAAWQLAKMRPPPHEAVEALTEVMKNDPIDAVRHSAQWAIKKIVSTQ